MMDMLVNGSARRFHDPSPEEVVDQIIHSLVNDARDIRNLAATERYREYLKECLPFIEEGFDQLRATMDVLNGSDA